ncbi:MAG: hypothetical protein ABIE68_05120 [bacterium]
MGIKIKNYKGELVHPSIDIKNGIAILGFRYFSEEQKDNNLYIISDGNEIDVKYDTNFVFDNNNYSIRLDNRKLANIEEKWDIDSLIEYIDNFCKETSNPAQVFKNIVNITKKYIELEREEDYLLISSWILGTYFFPAFSAYSFLHIKAPKRSGKTQLLNLLRQLAYNAIKARPSLAALGDTVDSLRGTYLIDQADSLRRKGNEELVDILTDSYKKEGGKRRIININNGKRQLLELDTYSPKVFASINDLPEDLADRCIVVPLIRSQKNFLEPSEENEKWDELRGEIYKLFLLDSDRVRSQYDVLKIHYKQNPKIIGRELELWLPLESILKVCLGNDSADIEIIQNRFRQLYGYTEYEASEIEKEVICIINNLVKNSDKPITLKPNDIRSRISKDDLWVDWYPSNHKKNIKIGNVIKKFNISSEKKNTSSGVAYSFDNSKVAKIHSLYLKNEIISSNTSPLQKSVVNKPTINEVSEIFNS